MDNSRKIRYEDYLQSSNWLKKRDLVLSAADHRCQICNATGNLHVHHRTYENLGEESLRDLVVLCDDCHELFHFKWQQNQQLSSINAVAEATLEEWGESSQKIYTGFREVDAALGGLEEGEVIVVGGESQVGKSSFVASMLLNFIRHDTKKGVYFDLGRTPRQTFLRLVAIDSRVPVGLLLESSKLEHDVFERVEWSWDYLQNSPCYIENTPSLTIDQIKQTILQLHKKQHLDFVIIDYLQLIRFRKSTPLHNPYNEMHYIMKTLKGIAKDIRVPIIAVSQLVVGNRPYKRPLLSDFRANTIGDTSDIVLLLYRPEMYDDRAEPGLAEVEIAKNWRGRKISIPLVFVKELLRFYGSCL